MINQPSQIKIIYEDDYFFVLDKPSGLTVNRSETVRDGERTLEDYIEEMRIERGLTDEIDRNGLVHRLDKETSGLIIAAKDPETKLLMQEEFKERRVQKKYLAVANGIFKDSYVLVEAPIARNPNDRMRYAIVQEGKMAITEFRKLKEASLKSEGEEGESVFTLLEAFPQTGRTHQIRVHLLALANPIASDMLYLNNKTYQSNRKFFPRLMLHAKSLKFEHPYIRKSFEIESETPPEFNI